jgi:glycosyltransferase involved in cell wall biosynthesis
MKALHLLDSLNRGGIEMLTLDVCRNAAANDLKLTFVATGGGELEDDFRSAGVEFQRLRRRLPLDLGLVRQLRAIVKERGVEIVHSHQAVEALHAYFATRGTPARNVLTLHGYIDNPKNRLALKYLLPRMDANVAVSRAFLERFRTEDGFDTSRNFQVVYNGVDAARLHSQRRTLRDELKLTDEQILCGMVGNFYFGVKDQLTVCRALPRVFAASPDVHFAFVGGRSASAPQLYDDCVRFCAGRGISERVHFLGARSDIADVLHSLDIFVFSSLQEGAPVAVIEALTAGLPCVVSDIGPLREVTGDGACGLIFRRGDTEDLAAQLIPLARSSDARAALSARAQTWATAQFSIETHISNLRKLYATLID